MEKNIGTKRREPARIPTPGQLLASALHALQRLSQLNYRPLTLAEPSLAEAKIREAVNEAKTRIKLASTLDESLYGKSRREEAGKPDTIGMTDSIVVIADGKIDILRVLDSDIEEAGGTDILVGRLYPNMSDVMFQNLGPTGVPVRILEIETPDLMSPRTFMAEHKDDEPDVL